MIRHRALTTLLAVSLVSGCGTPFYVTTEPRAAELYVDGKFVGIGSATVPTNGIVFNSYHVEARDRDGKVLNSSDVDVTFSARSAVFAGVGLVGIIVWPLLPLIPAALFVGEPSPERLHLRVPSDEPPPAARPDEIDRPVIEFASPAQGEQISATSAVVVKGRVKHWSGVRSVNIELDGHAAREIKPGAADAEISFTETLTIDSAGNHSIRVTAQGVRGAEAAEEVHVMRIVAK